MRPLGLGALMAGFWTRLEEWLLDLQRDRLRLARYMQWAYWISLLFVVLGFAIILYSYAEAWRL